MDNNKIEFPEWCNQEMVEEILEIISEFEEREKEACNAYNIAAEEKK